MDDTKNTENKVIATGVLNAWYDERCHIVPDGNINRWRCANCNLIHFFCIRCKQFKTIPDEWEPTSLFTLNKRMEFIDTNGWYCDPCWFAWREQVRSGPDYEPKRIYV